MSSKVNETKRYNVTFDFRFARRLDAIAHFKGLSTSQFIRMIIMDYVYCDNVVDDEKTKLPKI